MFCIILELNFNHIDAVLDIMIWAEICMQGKLKNL